MKRIYVAGPYSANNVLDVLRNIGHGQKVCADLFTDGFAPFCPWHDRTFVTDNPSGNFTVEQFYQYSLAWLKVSDAMLVIGDWEKSKGTVKEIGYAAAFDIPVFYHYDTLLAWSRK